LKYILDKSRVAAPGKKMPGQGSIRPEAIVSPSDQIAVNAELYFLP
jgi:hypothetical protein